MKKFLLIALVLVMNYCANAQFPRLETTIKIVSGKARISVKAVGGDITGTPSGTTFSVAIPVANNAADMLTPTRVDASRLPLTLSTPLGNYEDGTYEYFNLVYTGPNASVTFTSGVEYDLLELNWAGAAQSCPITLVSLPDGNPAATSNPSNWFNFLEVSGGIVSDPANLFYQSGSSNMPVQPIDYGAAGIVGSITTAALISLPANLLSFSGYKNGPKNTLQWTTGGESNNLGFDIQRSTDGVNYTSIGFVASKAPGGNSVSDLNYSFDDINPAAKKQYYRLEQQDFDGRTRLSNIVVISGDKPKSLGISGVFPNPARRDINVIVEAPGRDQITLLVLDITGKTVKQTIVSVETGSNTVPLEIGNLSAGSYLVKAICKSSDCETAVAKFNKQ